MILGVSFDTVKDNADFSNKFSYNFPLLCDTDRAIGMAYGATDKPDAGNAKRISYIIGPDGRIQHAFPKVDPKTHPQQVLDLLG